MTSLWFESALLPNGWANRVRVTAANGRIETVRLSPSGSKAVNYAFDVTPARLVTGLITERGVIAPNREALANAFPERIAKVS